MVPFELGQIVLHAWSQIKLCLGECLFRVGEAEHGPEAVTQMRK